MSKKLTPPRTPKITPRTQLSSGAISKLPSGFNKISINDNQPHTSTAKDWSDVSSEEYKTLSDEITHTSVDYSAVKN